jgi:hypothetical protein
MNTLYAFAAATGIAALGIVVGMLVDRYTRP